MTLHEQFLTAKQQLFVDAYMGPAKGNATKAAILAGYSEKTAAQEGSRLLRKVNIRKVIKERQHEVRRGSIADATERRELLTKMMRDPKEHPVARLKAVDIVNKMDGLYVHKHEHTGPNGQPIQVITGVPQPGDVDG